jgi:asparagine synthase (glutamine-hydrolysing)
MSGIAGIISLGGAPSAPADAIRRMSDAQAHRGSYEAIFEFPGIALAQRSASPIDESIPRAWVADGQIYNAEQLAGALGVLPEPVSHWGQLLPLLWRRDGVAMCDRLRGQFAFAHWDDRERRLLLARDHFGVCPLHWTRQGDWLLFASEIKALLASGMVEARADLRGIHHLWTFFGVPGPVTCFQGVSALLPGRYLEVRPAAAAECVREGTFWQMAFPDRGEEESSRNEAELIEEYESILLQALRRRLGGSAGVAMYSSGGLDSSLLVTMASQLCGGPPDTYTFNIQHPGHNESGMAADVAAHVGNRPRVVELTGSRLVEAFPRLVAAAESPIIDVSASALMQLAESIYAGGYRIAITGEGADEFQAGYPWFRIQQRLDQLDRLPGLPVSGVGFRAYVRLVHSRKLPWWFARRSFAAVHGKNAWLLAYLLMAAAKHEFFNRDLLDSLGDHVPLEDLGLNEAGLRRWHPLNRSIYIGARIHLPGLHLAARGDRAAGRSGVEGRYPFLDRDVFDFLAPLAPGWKLRGLTDKYLQRRLARRWLPPALGAGRKSLLHAPLDAFHRAMAPTWAEELLTDESLTKCGYFDAGAVRRWRDAIHQMRPGFRRLFIEMGLVGVISTQLWHQQFFDSSLADVDAAIAGA